MKRIARMFVGCCAAGCIAMLTTASAQVQADVAVSPAKLDYLLLASVADSHSLMGLSMSRADH